MTDPAVKTAACQYSYRYRLAETFQDVLVVSSFGLWAALLGFAPVVALCILQGG